MRSMSHLWGPFAGTEGPDQVGNVLLVGLVRSGRARCRGRQEARQLQMKLLDSNNGIGLLGLNE